MFVFSRRFWKWLYFLNLVEGKADRLILQVAIWFVACFFSQIVGRIFMRFLGVIKACNAVLEVFMYVQLIQVSNLDRKRGFDSRNWVLNHMLSMLHFHWITKLDIFSVKVNLCLHICNLIKLSLNWHGIGNYQLGLHIQSIKILVFGPQGPLMGLQEAKKPQN